MSMGSMGAITNSSGSDMEATGRAKRARYLRTASETTSSAASGRLAHIRGLAHAGDGEQVFHHADEPLGVVGDLREHGAPAFE